MIRINLIEKLKVIFRINKGKSSESRQGSVGILNESKGSTFKNNKVSGFETAMIDKGENTTTEENEFKR
ncbi:MAG: hypothetical protein A3H06_00425 [Candidatus Colwellbacteria bacterium RIFCSPLOWO2_12_FULL_44_13]|uniref:Uncharacterized protein n=3 Tax=Candidatus Colwelliibacteriota TaxID=1817904 RepID=A0A1G1Z5D1_9BACT|nr:MAG: hypothetical protein A3F24_02035 [Candidatus Colwellbacteria bacterium RIFCSPHIGHO2_12_FULL_44_17]OGY59832.1 MAG: hypothetical protein A3I31_01650 [Candidatus Colwellbacteria bacterium RIFCSPLOWO2_02_FULL_44_20b]OGY61557.1 MAG: hypothetical protein A3H06_00425 [Candidatus Colwellbacteria bacterium RIFCSPLOWO2_12_FULL_44_13]